VDSFPTKAEAETEARRLRRRLPGRLNVEQALNLYRDELARRGRRPRSIQTTLDRLNQWHDPEMPLDDVTPAQLEQTYQARCSRVAVATHRNELSEVKGFWRWLVRTRRVSSSPAAGIDGVGRPNRGKPQLRRAEARLLDRVALRAARTGDQGALALLLVVYLGLRNSEVISRQVRDVDVDQDGVLFWVPTSKTEAGRRWTEVPEPLAGLLSAYVAGRAPDAWLFPGRTQTGHRRKKWLCEACKRLCGQAGVPEVTPHGIRGTFSTLAREAGLASSIVAQELGHTSDTVTKQHYLEPGAEDRAQAKRTLRVLNGGR